MDRPASRACTRSDSLVGGARTAAKPPVVELTSAKTAFDLSADLSSDSAATS